MKPVLSPKAARQWKKILEFFNQRNGTSDYSIKLDLELHRVLVLICTQPDMGQATSRRNTLRHTFKSYAVFYRIDGDWIKVVAIIDGRRDRKME